VNRSRYLLRFDDICPSMNWTVWERIEALLRQHGIAPLVSVVSDNGDEGLTFGPPNEHFWDRVRTWEQWGWTIGMHGYQHRYVSADSGIMGIKKASEFAGLALEEQRAKLEAASEIFRREGVQPRVWVAPGHSFDHNTVRALKAIGLCVISDGFFVSPRLDPDGMLWIPQQLWRFRWLPFGIWTVCVHHNRWDGAQFATFARDVVAYKDRIVGFDHVIGASQNLKAGRLDGPLSRAFRLSVWLRFRLKRRGVADGIS